MNYYLVGIKGSGMCALALILKQLNNIVIGSDKKSIFYTDNILKKENIKVLPFNKKNISSEYLYIISNCYDDNNKEVYEIKKRKYQYYYYHDFIEKFFKNKIGISGTHGKTTTTSFICDLLRKSNISALIGDGLGIGNVNYEYFILEACEYKKHILTYSFEYLVINNIDNDHLDCFSNLKEINDTFVKASKNTKVLICHEDVQINHQNKYTFGKSENNYCYYKILKEDNKGYQLLINIDKKEIIINYQFCGEHMINNLLASITVYYLIKKDLKGLQFKINNLRLPNRRMKELYYNDNIIIDDYAHHPTEINALIKSIKQKYPLYILSVVFQPHTYTRTILLAKEFRLCFSQIDNLYIRKTFTSNREKYNKRDERKVNEILNKGKQFKDKTFIELLKKNKQVIVFVGAGDNDNYIEKMKIKMKILSENS